MKDYQISATNVVVLDIWEEIVDGIERNKVVPHKKEEKTLVDGWLQTPYSVKPTECPIFFLVMSLMLT